MSETNLNSPVLPRRSFFKESMAIIVGGVAMLVPVGAGLAVIMDPARRKTASTSAIRVATLSALPADGVPRKFQVIASRTDAWNKYPQSAVGAVYLRRVGENEVTAFNVACPHAGCFVDFSAAKGLFLCPCHNSSFAVNGAISDPSSPSPRAMDSLEVEIRNGAEIWVRFQNFQPGEKAKVPVA